MSSNTESQGRLALVVVVDGLRASALGTYGNTSFSTPQFDALASRSVVVEWLLGVGTTASSFYGAALQGLDLGGARRWLVTDDRTLCENATASQFDEIISLEPGVERSANTIEATHSAKFFANVVEHLAPWRKDVADRQANGVLWVHFSGLCGPWDGPLALREELLDAEDPPASKIVVPPAEVHNVVDPDELLSYRVAYAAQVSVLEACIAGLMEEFHELPSSAEKLAMIAGARGFALGEHGCVGYGCQSLYSEVLHVPWLLMASGSADPLPRVAGFAQPRDLGATLAHWLSKGTPASEEGGISIVPFMGGQPGYLRDAVVASNDAGEQMIRTPAWSQVQGSRTELYAKSDDRWEANDVASRCPEIVDQLSAHIEAIIAGRVEPLTDELLSPWR